MNRFEKEFRIIDMCRVFEVSRSGYYAWLKRPLSNHDRKELEVIKPAVREAFAASRQTYGCVRISRELINWSIPVSAKRAARIMREESLIPKAARRFKVTTDSNHQKTASPDLVRREFTSDAPGKLWTSDFTAIWTGEGWLYLAAFLDVFSRLIVGWAAAATMTESLLVTAFNNAVAKRIPQPEMVTHSDKGGQYFGKLFRSLLKLFGIRQSMGTTGDCYDNAITESLWNTIKTECFFDYIPVTWKEGREMLFDYIETFYNTQRLHSSLGYISPEDYELSKNV
jgi:transposase InsO family protein